MGSSVHTSVDDSEVMGKHKPSRETPDLTKMYAYYRKQPVVLGDRDQLANLFVETTIVGFFVSPEQLSEVQKLATECVTQRFPECVIRTLSA